VHGVAGALSHSPHSSIRIMYGPGSLARCETPLLKLHLCFNFFWSSGVACWFSEARDSSLVHRPGRFETRQYAESFSGDQRTRVCARTSKTSAKVDNMLFWSRKGTADRPRLVHSAGDSQAPLVRSTLCAHNYQKTTHTHVIARKLISIVCCCAFVRA
jgi:hypothetical protein